MWSLLPALVPRRPGDRVKTNRRDEENLVRLYRAGELTEIRVPTPQEEAARDLVRATEDTLKDRLRARHRLKQVSPAPSPGAPRDEKLGRGPPRLASQPAVRFPAPPIGL